ncbi:hypothetical protein HD596_000386 [Nonomuraea jabiensis]|uniref:Uncharacterized protein n=1 Tax=Nonomuraea jabiensis TaxID=882448 RepID=A0A7W9FXX9_9ACTN|nr:hypothetical protein [Nonomuraea jabiensis]
MLDDESLAHLAAELLDGHARVVRPPPGTELVPGHASWFKVAIVFFDWTGSRNILAIDPVGIAEAARSNGPLERHGGDGHPGQAAPERRARRRSADSPTANSPAPGVRVTVERRIRAAYQAPIVLLAEAALTSPAAELERTHPGAAASLREGLSETLTVRATNTGSHVALNQPHRIDDLHLPRPRHQRQTLAAGRWRSSGHPCPKIQDPLTARSLARYTWRA